MRVFGNLIFAIIARILCGNHLKLILYPTIHETGDRGFNFFSIKLFFPFVCFIELEISQMQIEQPEPQIRSCVVVKTTVLSIPSKQSSAL